MTGSDPEGRLSIADFDLARSVLQVSRRASAGVFNVFEVDGAAAELEFSVEDAPAPTDAFRM